MSLPNYIVNLDELLQILQGVFAGTDEITSKIQKSKGLMLNSSPLKTQNISWIPDEDIAITGVRFGQEDIRNLGYRDYFNMTVDGEEVMTNVYCKELNEYKLFRDYYLVAKNTTINFEYYNGSTINKEVKFDIDYIEATMPQKEFIILCRDKETGELIGKFTMFYTPIFEGLINPPNILNYTPITEPISVLVKPYSPSPKTVTFLYDFVPPPPPIPDPEIDHYYDFKFVLRWEGNVDTDLDFYAILDNGEKIYFGNKEYLPNESNGIWLDIDYTSHSESNARETKPEVMTILGKPSPSVKFIVNNWRDGDKLTEKVTVDVFKVREDNTEELIDTVTKQSYEFQKDGVNVYMLTFNTSSHQITKH